MVRRDDATGSEEGTLGHRIASAVEAAAEPCDELVRLIGDATGTTCWLFARPPASPALQLVGTPRADVAMAAPITAAVVERSAASSAMVRLDAAEGDAHRDPAATEWLRDSGRQTMLTVPLATKQAAAVLVASPAPASTLELELLCACVTDVVDRHVPWVLVERAAAEARTLRRTAALLERTVDVALRHGGGRAALIDAKGTMRPIGAHAAASEADLAALLADPISATLVADAAAGTAGQAALRRDDVLVELVAEPDGLGGVVAVARDAASLPDPRRPGTRALADRLAAFEDLAATARGEIHDDGLQVIGAVGHRLGLLAAAGGELGEELHGLVAALGAACDAIAGALEVLPAGLGEGQTLLSALEAMRGPDGAVIGVRADVEQPTTGRAAATLHAFARDAVGALGDRVDAIELMARGTGVRVSVSGRGEEDRWVHERALAAAMERVRALGGSASVLRTPAGELAATASFADVAHLH